MRGSTSNDRRRLIGLSPAVCRRVFVEADLDAGVAVPAKFAKRFEFHHLHTRGRGGCLWSGFRFWAYNAFFQPVGLGPLRRPDSSTQSPNLEPGAPKRGLMWRTTENRSASA